eukprot:scaffold181864_cov32-Tisochrysis_lutea.AAC.4
MSFLGFIVGPRSFMRWMQGRLRQQPSWCGEGRIQVAIKNDSIASCLVASRRTCENWCSSSLAANRTLVPIVYHRHTSNGGYTVEVLNGALVAELPPPPESDPTSPEDEKA